MIYENISGVPRFSCDEFAPKKTKYCVLIPIINEGERIKAELQKAQRRRHFGPLRHYHLRRRLNRRQHRAGLAFQPWR